jgi:putative restriction endonuclease
MALASVQRGEPRLQPYAEVGDRLRDLLVAFGPPRKRIHPEYPFWRLQNDGSFWEIPQRAAALEVRGDRSGSGGIPSSILADVGAEAGFTPELYARLRDDRELVVELTADILEEHFPPSMHEELLNAVGMPWVMLPAPAARSPEFRSDVLRLYEHRCAMCGFDGQLGGADLALEAAHVMWHAMGGPDDPTNGLLLCSLHHKALDRGALGLTDDRRVVVSQHVRGGSEVSRLIIGLGGRPVSRPIDPSASLEGRYIAWHRREVFRAPARPAA